VLERRPPDPFFSLSRFEESKERAHPSPAL
jgi:hypothetical protein